MIRWRQEQQNLAVDFDTGSLPMSDRERQPLEQSAGSIRNRCHDLPHAALHVRVNQDARDGEFEVEMVLEAMQRSLRGIGKADNVQDAAQFAREKIVSQLAPFKAVLRRDEIYQVQHRENVSDGVGAMSSPASSGDNSEIREFEKNLEGYWRPLVRQVSREISALEMNNLLPLGELAAQDVVDEVIVRAFERFRERPTEIPVEIWLYRLARQVLMERREQLQREAPMSSIPPARRMTYAEPPPPPNPLTEPMDVLMDLLEPEDDLMPGEGLAEQAEPSDPTMPMRRTEMQQALRKIVSHLPGSQREAIWLHYLDGFETREIAAVQDRSEKDVRSDLEQAVSRLRDAMHGWRGWQGEVRDEGMMHREPPEEHS